MTIRRAQQKDMPAINNLLAQVLEVHHRGRPDIFKSHVKKYTDAELLDILQDEKKPIFVVTDEEDSVLGYAFCICKEVKNNTILVDSKTLYIDDLCVDENRRGQHIGKALYDYVLQYAKESGCSSLTLNVWECNPSARKFYEKQGLIPQRTIMETLL